MIEWFKLGLRFQKDMLDVQVRQIQAAEQMLEAAASQVETSATMTETLRRAAEQQRAALNGWFDFWGVNR
jgi:hypothetical protein